MMVSGFLDWSGVEVRCQVQVLPAETRSGEEGKAWTAVDYRISVHQA